MVSVVYAVVSLHITSASQDVEYISGNTTWSVLRAGDDDNRRRSVLVPRIRSSDRLGQRALIDDLRIVLHYDPRESMVLDVSCRCSTQHELGHRR